jgi:predicted glycoside hydrolase/deacetylase ChbG (UPF0249 family)
MVAERRLIVNADDFGQSPGINQGIIGTFERGIVTSASLMVRWPAAAAAAAYSRKRPEFSIGLHVDLGEWAYQDEAWSPVYEVVPLNDPVAVAEEVACQLAIFRHLMGKKPTHIDSHQPVHREEPTDSLLSALARQLAIPLRGCHPAIRYCGNFYGQTGKGEACPDAINVDGLVKILEGLPPGITELGCHPGYGTDGESMYRQERATEVKTLCHPQIRAALAAQGIRLCSFGDLPAARSAPISQTESFKEQAGEPPALRLF